MKSIAQSIKQNEMTERGAKTLSENMFVKEYRLICDKSSADWLKYKALYLGIAPKLQVNDGADNKEGRDALQCLELLVEVLSNQPTALLNDLIHMLSKHKMAQTRTETMEQIHQSLTLQRAHLSARRKLLSTIDSSINIYQREAFTSESSTLVTFCLSQAHFEALNARSVHEAYRRI